MTYNLPHNIDVLLSIHNLKQPEFGKLIGNSSGAAVSSWIKGRVNPPIDKVVAISEQFNVSLDVLIFGHVGMPNERLNTWEEENKEFAEGEALYLKIKEARELVKKDSAGVVFLDHGIFDRHDELNALVRFLSKNHDKLKEDEIYRLYLGRVILEAQNNEEREALKKMALQKQEKKS